MPEQVPPTPAPTGFVEVDRLVHEPARMGILTILSSVQSAEFLFLQSTLGLSKGNLSSHLSKLESGGLVQISKTFVGKKPQTTASITAAGSQAIARYWTQLDQLRGLGRVP
jgi:DNA-binding MarR family transcriptional regulator